MNFFKSFILGLFFIFVFSLVSFAATANSSGSAPSVGAGLVFEVEKSVSSVNVTLDSPFTVTIKVKNLDSAESSFIIRESASNFQMVDPVPKEYSTPSDDILAVRPPSYDWSISIPANSEKSVTYSARAKMVGSLTIGPTEVISPSKKVLSNALVLNVACTSSNRCEDSLGENGFTCPQKCSSQNLSENDSISPPSAPEISWIQSSPANDSVSSSKGASEDVPIPFERILPFALGALAVVALLVYFFVLKKK